MGALKRGIYVAALTIAAVVVGAEGARSTVNGGPVIVEAELHRVARSKDICESDIAIVECAEKQDSPNYANRESESSDPYSPFSGIRLPRRLLQLLSVVVFSAAVVGARRWRIGRRYNPNLAFFICPVLAALGGACFFLATLLP